MLKKHLGHITLILLVLLFALKIFLGGCRLWICALFVTVVVTYMILSDFYPQKEEPPDDSAKKHQD
ncbi:hypothetical protein LA303_00780 [Candidatus Sulfidibacterium hydrothermale]|uniref:hypothetical protein n=1 Tax=Candidatus Sulfidibacterium hydrothermale TaxID=2875962 RepID=UPI001F0A93CA|nr:hypothetical protein [Candidatus Sulfidibacterium hydrothermale]UBM62531.1 hypothetical protein LA303_00780 [Candidatus Sulfidibacterium hydrothermale]